MPVYTLMPTDVLFFRDGRPLKTAGLFPVLENSDWLFPAPLDFVPSKEDLLQVLGPLRSDTGDARHNPLEPLRYSLGNPCAPSKEEPEPWWSKGAFEAYLN